MGHRRSNVPYFINKNQFHRFESKDAENSINGSKIKTRFSCRKVTMNMNNQVIFKTISHEDFLGKGSEWSQKMPS